MMPGVKIPEYGSLEESLSMLRKMTLPGDDAAEIDVKETTIRTNEGEVRLESHMELKSTPTSVEKAPENTPPGWNAQ